MRKTLIKALLKAGRDVEIHVTGRCMEPLLRQTDKVKVKACEALDIGDICLIDAGKEGLYLHRLVKREGGALITKGDFEGKHECIRKENMIGVLEAIKVQGSNAWKTLDMTRDEGARIAKWSWMIDPASGLGGERRRAIREQIWHANEIAREKLTGD